MLTRLKVNGFKNLVDVDVRFGPFTCIAGVNGVGKSNLFDAIRFLSELARGPNDGGLSSAAASVRRSGEASPRPRDLFTRSGEYRADVMRFEAEMIIPASGVSPLYLEVKASSTLLRYILELRLGERYGLEIVREELHSLSRDEIEDALKFGASNEWRKSALVHNKSDFSYIEMLLNSTEPLVVLRRETGTHDDLGEDKDISSPASQLPRTMLSSQALMHEAPTVYLAQQEILSWRTLSLEPAAIRKPDGFDAPHRIGDDGSHVAATLYRACAESHKHGGDPSQVKQRISNRMLHLLGEVMSVDVDRDEKRELYTVIVRDRDKTEYPSSALSEGTLRFLALSVLLEDGDSGLLCLEEPENGIHPRKTKEMLDVLEDIALDTDFPVDRDNPLRQVIVNTHSPLLVQCVHEADLLFAERHQVIVDGHRLNSVAFRPLSETWRAKSDTTRRPVSPGIVLEHIGHSFANFAVEEESPAYGRSRRVFEREDFRHYLSTQDS